MIELIISTKIKKDKYEIALILRNNKSYDFQVYDNISCENNTTTFENHYHGKKNYIPPLEYGFKILLFSTSYMEFNSKVWEPLKEALDLNCAFVSANDDYKGCVLNWPNIFTQSNCHSKKFKDLLISENNEKPELMKPLIPKRVMIAFSGSIGSGKTTAAKYLASHYDGEYMSFSEPIYEIMNYVQDKCGFKKEKDRDFLITIADLAKRKDINTWINAVDRKIQDIPEETNLFLGDLRFKNEFNYLKNKGWTLVKIERNDTNYKNLYNITDYTNHYSENDLNSISDSKWDYIIQNNGSLEDFFLQITSLMVNR